MKDDDPLVGFDPDKGWYHDDEGTGFCGYVPPLSRGDMFAIAEKAGLRFLAPGTDQVTCPGEKDHVFPTVKGACEVFDNRGVPRLTCPNYGCELKCAEKNAAMAAILFENARIEQRVALWDRDDGTTDRILEEMMEANERKAHWEWERENSPIEDKQGDCSSGTKNEDGERGPCAGTVLRKCNVLRQQIQRMIDSSTEESK